MCRMLFERSSLLRIMINFRSIISGTMTAALSNNIIKKSGATAFPLASGSPMRPLAFLSSSQGASPLLLVNTYGRHHAIMLRVDHSYGYPLEMPPVILSERRMYNAKTRTFQAKAKIRANSKDTNITVKFQYGYEMAA